MRRLDSLLVTCLLLDLAGCSRRPASTRDSGTDVTDAAGDTDGTATVDVAVDLPFGDGSTRDGSFDVPFDVPLDAPINGSITGSDVVVVASGNVVVSGTLNGTVDLGAGALTSSGAGDLVLAAFNSAGGVLWSRRWGDAASQGGGALASDASGNLFLATSFAGRIDLGGGELASAGSTDICLAKLDAQGRHQWSARFGDAALQWATGAAVDSTGRFVASGYSQTPFEFGNASPDAGTGGATITSSIVSLDSGGNRLWSKTWPAAQIASIAVDAADNVLVAGSFTNSVDFGGGPLAPTGTTNVFIVSLAANGNHRWSRRFGNGGSAAALAVATDGAGNVLVTGFFDDTVDFGGGPLVSVRVPGRTVVSNDVFVAKLEGSAGAHVWSRRFGDGEEDQGSNSIAADSAGDVFVAGNFRGTIDFGLGALSAAMGETFVVKLDARGAPLWHRQLVGSGGQIGVAPPAGLLVTGAFPVSGPFPSARATLAGGSNVFLVEYPP